MRNGVVIPPAAESIEARKNAIREDVRTNIAEAIRFRMPFLLYERREDWLVDELNSEAGGNYVVQLAPYGQLKIWLTTPVPDSPANQYSCGPDCGFCAIFVICCGLVLLLASVLPPKLI